MKCVAAVAGLVLLLFSTAEDGVELARARAGAGVASVGGVTEAARADMLRVTGGPGGGAGCWGGPGGNGTRG